MKSFNSSNKLVGAISLIIKIKLRSFILSLFCNESDVDGYVFFLSNLAVNYLSGLCNLTNLTKLTAFNILVKRMFDDCIIIII